MLDTVSGELKDTRTRYLGSRPVKLFRIMMQGSEAVSVVYGRSIKHFASVSPVLVHVTRRVLECSALTSV